MNEVVLVLIRILVVGLFVFGVVLELISLSYFRCIWLHLRAFAGLDGLHLLQRMPCRYRYWVLVLFVGFLLDGVLVEAIGQSNRVILAHLYFNLPVFGKAALEVVDQYVTLINILDLVLLFVA